MQGREFERAIWLDLTYEAKCLLRRYPAAPRVAALELADLVRRLIEIQVGGPVADDLVLRVAKRAVIDSRPRRNPGPRWNRRWPESGPGDGSGSREPRRPIVPSLAGCIEVALPADPPLTSRAIGYALR